MKESIQNFVKYVSVGGFVISVITVVILYYQVSLMNEDFNFAHRPWLGVEDVLITKSDQPRFIIKNYGTLPNTQSKIMVSWNAEPLTRDVLIKNGNFLSGNIIMPNSDFAVTASIPHQKIQDARNGTSLYIGIIINYEYGNKKSEYGAVLKYFGKDRFQFIDTWVKE